MVRGGEQCFDSAEHAGEDVVLLVQEVNCGRKLLNLFSLGFDCLAVLVHFAVLFSSDVEGGTVVSSVGRASIDVAEVVEVGVEGGRGVECRWLDSHSRLASSSIWLLLGGGFARLEYTGIGSSNSEAWTDDSLGSKADMAVL